MPRTYAVAAPRPPVRSVAELAQELGVPVTAIDSALQYALQHGKPVPLPELGGIRGKLPSGFTNARHHNKRYYQRAKFLAWWAQRTRG